MSEFELTDFPVGEADILQRVDEAWNAALNTVNIGKFNLGWASIGICTHAFYEAIHHAAQSFAVQLHGKPSTTPEQMEFCLSMIHKPVADADRADRIWTEHVYSLRNAYEMQPRLTVRRRPPRASRGEAVANHPPCWRRVAAFARVAGEGRTRRSGASDSSSVDQPTKRDLQHRTTPANESMLRGLS